MSKLPLLKYQKIEKALIKLGFKIIRQKGSHIFFSHLDGRTTVVPNHGGKQIGRGLLRTILNDIKISPDEWQKI